LQIKPQAPSVNVDQIAALGLAKKH
jgi:hypothetical protein